VNSKLEVLPSARDLRFDTLRGFFLVCMTINHLPTEIREVTDQPVGIFSAAEGFVFLSGLISGWVYTRKFREFGAAGLRSASVNRAKSIYRWHVGSLVAAFVCVQLTERILGFCSPTVPRLFFEHPLESLGLGVSLLYQPGLLDLLPMYCVFIMLLPTVIRSLEAGRKWLVLGISGAVWLAVQWAPPVDGAPLYPMNTGSFNLFAWQFLFLVGVTIGHARISGAPQLVRPSRWVVAAAALVAVYGFGLHHDQWIRLWPDHVFGIFLNKPALGLFRMADFGCVAYLVGVFGTQFPKWLMFRPLAFLGRHSLAVVAAQSVAVMVLLQFTDLYDTRVASTLSTVVVVGILFAVAGARQLAVSRGRSASAAAIGARRPPTPSLVRPDDARAA
jgi:hypothetical protein